MSDRSGSIAGRVVDPAGAPVSGASVAVHTGPGPVDDIAALTGPDGRFRLGNLGPGRYELAAFAAGNTEARVQVDVVLEGTSEVEIRFGGDAGPAPPPPPGEPPVTPPVEPPVEPAGVRVLTDRIDWNQVRLVRLSLRPAGAGPDVPTAEFLFSPTSNAPVVWETAAGGRYTFTASFFLDGGLQRTLGPLDGEGPLELDARQGVTLP